MFKKVALLIVLSFFAQASNDKLCRDLKSELLSAVTLVKPVQDIIWGYLYKWEVEHQVEQKNKKYYPQDFSFSPDGKYITIFLDYPFIQYINAQTGQLEKELIVCASGYRAHNRSIHTPDGNYFVLRTDGGTAYTNITVICQKSGTVVSSRRSDGLIPESFSPKGSYLRAASNDSVELWSIRHGTLFTVKRLRNGHAGMTFLDRSTSTHLFSPDEKNMLAIVDEVYLGHDSDGALIGAREKREFVLQIWDIQTETVIQEITNQDIVLAAWSPDGATIATVSSDETIKLWQKKNGFELVKFFNNDFPGRAFCVSQFIWSPDSKYILLSSRELLKIYDVKTGTCADIIAGDRVSCAPDGSRIATLDYSRVSIYRNQVVDIELQEAERKKQAAKAQATASSSCVIS